MKKKHILTVVPISKYAATFENLTIHEVINKIDDVFYQTHKASDYYYVVVLNHNTVLIQKGYSATQSIVRGCIDTNIYFNELIIVFQVAELSDCLALLQSPLNPFK
jgi:hypothetical protein